MQSVARMLLFQYVDNCVLWWLSFRRRSIRRVASMKIFRKIFRGKKKKHVVNKKRRTTSRARNTSRTRDAHLLKDDFLFGAGTRRSKVHRRKHKVCAKKERRTECRCQRISQCVCYGIACKQRSSHLKTLPTAAMREEDAFPRRRGHFLGLDWSTALKTQGVLCPSRTGVETGGCKIPLCKSITSLR